MNDKFYVGARVICIKDHSKEIVKKGQIFKVEGVRKSKCKCPGIELNIGIKGVSNTGDCPICNTDFYSLDEYWWFADTLFKLLPDEEISDITTEELLKEIEHGKETIRI